MLEEKSPQSPRELPHTSRGLSVTLNRGAQLSPTGLVWGQEHKALNSNYRPSPNSEEDSGIWPYFLPLFLYICLYSVFYLDLKVFNTQEKWLYLSVPLVFHGKEFEAHSKNCVYSCQ